MKFHVRPLQRAKLDVVAILDWIGDQRQSPQGAANWLDAYEAAAASLTESPESHGLAPENDYVKLTVRQFLFKTRQGRTYRGLYTIEGDEVLILRVRGAGQPLLQADEIQ